MWLVSVVCPLFFAHWLSHAYKMVKSYPITLLELLKNLVSHIVACTVLKLILSSFAENECLPLCTTFLTHLVFSGLAIILAFSSLGMSIICCMPIWKIQNIFTTTVFHTHLAPQTTDISLWISAGSLHYPLRNWIMDLWFCWDSFITWYTIFKLHCNLHNTTYPVNSSVLNECLLSMCTELNKQLHHLHCYSSSLDRFQLHIPHKRK
jgi:hypothetical protein